MTDPTPYRGEPGPAGEPRPTARPGTDPAGPHDPAEPGPAGPGPAEPRGAAERGGAGSRDAVPPSGDRGAGGPVPVPEPGADVPETADAGAVPPEGDAVSEAGPGAVRRPEDAAGAGDVLDPAEIQDAPEAGDARRPATAAETQDAVPAAGAFEDREGAEDGDVSGGVPGEGEAAEPSLRAGLEAILMVVDEPVPEVTLAQILERPREEVAAALRGLAAEYTGQGRGFELREIAGGWRYYTRDVCAPLVERFVLDGQQARLTQAALETLAVVAYRQPVSRARVSAIRGVNSDGVIRTLTLRGLIEEAGHDPEHQAVLYRTTGYFLERLGLNSLDELPDLAPYLPDDVEGIEELQQ